MKYCCEVENNGNKKYVDFDLDNDIDAMTIYFHLHDEYECVNELYEMNDNNKIKRDVFSSYREYELIYSSYPELSKYESRHLLYLYLKEKHNIYGEDRFSVNGNRFKLCFISKYQ